MIIPNHCLYTDGQVFVNRKESYIAVTNDKGNVLFFCLIGFKTIRETEGTAILKALEYLQERNITEAMIYTDSLDWAGIANGTHRVNSKSPAYELSTKIITLKEELLTTIQWKRRNFNKAGHFLGAVWRTRKDKRPPLRNLISLQVRPKLQA